MTLNIKQQKKLIEANRLFFMCNKHEALRKGVNNPLMSLRNRIIISVTAEHSQGMNAM